jgi:PAS domain S-box-containing protein
LNYKILLFIDFADKKSAQVGVNNLDQSDSPRQGKLKSYFQWYWIRVVLVALLYIGTAEAGSLLQAGNDDTVLVLPAAGLAVVALLFYGNSIWIGVCMGATAVSLLEGLAPVLALGTGIISAGQAVLAVWVLQRLFHFRHELERFRDVFLFVDWAGILCPEFGAFLITGLFYLNGAIGLSEFWETFLLRWLGESLGIVIIAPLCFTWSNFNLQKMPFQQIVQGVILFSLITLCSWCLFVYIPAYPNLLNMLMFLLYPLVILAVLSWEQFGGTFSVFLIMCIAVWGTLNHHGPFALYSPLERIFSIWLYLEILMLTALTIGAGVLAQKRSEQKARESEARYLGILQDQTDMLFRYKPNGELVFVNRSFQSYYGSFENDWIGTNCLAYLCEEYIPKFQRSILSLDAEHPYKCVELCVINKEGEVRWNQWTNRAIFNEDGDIIEIQTVGLDINDRKQWENELQKAKDHAEAASLAKSKFLATMSHELRTPLNSIIGFASQLVRNKWDHLSEREIIYASRIRENGLHLLSLINDILDLSKIEAGRTEIIKKRFSLKNLLEEIGRQFEDQFQQKSLKLEIVYPPEVDDIENDEGKLKQVLINLVGNAYKFTQEGGVVVQVHVAEGTTIPERIDVTDTGIGIPADQITSIFKAFQQVDNQNSRKYSGTGLGLTISRSLCHMMGYQLLVQSEVGKGSTFSILFQHELSSINFVPVLSEMI